MTSDKKRIDIMIENPRNGEENLPVILGDNLSKACEYLNIGTTVGIKAKLHNEGNKVRIIAEKITFINTKKDE